MFTFPSNIELKLTSGPQGYVAIHFVYIGFLLLEEAFQKF